MLELIGALIFLSFCGIAWLIAAVRHNKRENSRLSESLSKRSGELKGELDKCVSRQVMAKKDNEQWDMNQREMLARLVKLDKDWNTRWMDVIQKIALMEPKKNAGI